MGNRTGSIAVRRQRPDMARKPKFGGPDATAGEGPRRGVPRCLNTDALGLHSKRGVGCRKRTRWMEAGVSRFPHAAQKPIAIAGVCFVAGSRRKALRIATAALDCGFNRSMQHTNLLAKRGRVADEVQDEDLLHRS
jgi:hypothetical protein